MIDERVSGLCEEFGLRIVPQHRRPGPGETRAVATLRRIIEKEGFDQAHTVLLTLADTSNNKASLEAEVFGAVSDLLKSQRSWYDEDPSKWLDVFDAIPIGELQAIAHRLRGAVPLRAALAGLIFERIWRAYGPRATQPDLLDDRGPINDRS